MQLTGVLFEAGTQVHVLAPVYAEYSTVYPPLLKGGLKIKSQTIYRGACLLYHKVPFNLKLNETPELIGACWWCICCLNILVL